MISKRTKYPPKPNYPPNNNGSDEPVPGRCGAKLRNKDKYCKRWPISKNGRCGLHGGVVKGLSATINNTTKALKSGLYAKFLTEEDKEVYFGTELGTIDEEIRMAKVQVARAYRAQYAYDIGLKENGRNEQGMVLMEISITRGDHTEIKKVKRRDDYKNEIRQASRLVAKLEGLRAELIKSVDPQDNPDSPLNKLVQALSNIRNGDE